MNGVATHQTAQMVAVGPVGRNPRQPDPAAGTSTRRTELQDTSRTGALRQKSPRRVKDCSWTGLRVPNASFAVSRIFAENCKPVVRLKQSRLDGFDGDVNH